MVDPRSAPDALTLVRRVHAGLNRLDGHGHRPALPSPDAAPVAVRLPPARPLPPGTLEQVLVGRRSGYAFGPEQPALAQLSDLLRWSLGAQRDIPLGDGRWHRAGMAPSAGGLRSLDPWLLVRGPGGLAPGVHRAVVRDTDRDVGGVLTRTHTGDPTAYLAAALDQPQFATRATVFVVLVARLDSTLPVYGPRHYRTVHLDAGIALQNLYLVGTALGLPGCAVSGFDDDAISRLLQLDDSAFPAVLFACGSQVHTVP